MKNIFVLLIFLLIPIKCFAHNIDETATKICKILDMPAKPMLKKLKKIKIKTFETKK